MMTVMVPLFLMKDIASIAAALLGPLSLRLATVTRKAARAARTTGTAVSSARRRRGRAMTGRSASRLALLAPVQRARLRAAGTGVAMIWPARSVNAAGEAR